ncbi:MAG: CapA family protein [Oscillospiraceae bacterium]|jgi:poly-gamma-glutamate synthesis protein (capsule biosynthesis protein)|nr:CapA family protein [Oscillospiraceae bacterium]
MAQLPSPSPPPTPTPPPDPSSEPSPEPSPEPEPAVITLQFAGDILLHSGLIQHAKTGDYAYDFKPFFEAVKPFIDGDLILCNMETPVDVYGGNKNLSTYPLFNAPYEILEGLRYAGFNHLIHANNHVFDKKIAGLEATLENFRRAGFSHTGTYADEEALRIPTVLNVKGIKVGVLAYTDSVNGLEPWVPADKLSFAVRRFISSDLSSLPRMTEDIAALREAGAEVVIVSLHWGAEYVDAPTETQRTIARGLCDAGADVIMGHHSHCVQPIERYIREDGAESLILYSLGNFFADQSGKDPPTLKTQYGMLVSLTVTKTPEGAIILGDCTVIPTLCGRVKGETSTLYTLLPLLNAEETAAPVTIYGSSSVTWGERAYEHVRKIVGDAFIRQAPPA